MLKSLSKLSRSAGGALVELCLVLLVLVPLGLWSWDIGAKLIAKQLHLSLALQMTLGYFPAPLSLNYDKSDEFVKINVIADAAGNPDVKSYLDEFVSNTHSQYGRSGTGSGAPFDFAIEYWTFTIHDPEKAPAAIGAPSPGQAWKPLRVGPDFYRGDIPSTACFDGAPDKAEFDAFVASRIAKLLALDTATEPAIGTRVMEVMQGTTPYRPFNDLKVLMFVMYCSKPPLFFSDEAMLTPLIVVPRREVNVGVEVP